MGETPRNNGHRITRLTISGGKRAEPRLVTTSPSSQPRDYRLGIAFTIAVVVIIALAGRSL
jgi:hypothetical protein